jgi:hypothetical protein
MKRFIPLAIVVLLFCSATAIGVARTGPASPYTLATGTTCYNKVILYEDPNGQGDNHLVLCAADGSGNGYWSNLGAFAVVDGDRLCTKFLGNSTVWNDCAGSAVIRLYSGYCAFGYKDTYWSGQVFFSIRGPANFVLTNFTGSEQDGLSSVQIQSGSC